MPKRVAEHQLTKDGGDAASDEEGQGGVPAAPVTGRVIRGMPKRKGLAGTPASAPVPPAEEPAAAPAPAQAAPSFGSSVTPAATASPFGGFSFGAPKPAASTPSFSFGAPAPTEAAPKITEPPKAFSGFSFGAPSTPSLSFGSSPAAPAAAPAKAPSFGFNNGNTTSSFASSSTKPADEGKPSSPFSAGGATPTLPQSEPEPSKKAAPAPFSGFSFGAPAEKPKETAPPPAQPSLVPATASQANGRLAVETKKPTPTSENAVDEKETAYLIQLRGLNVSILQFLSSQLEADPLLDLTSVLTSLGSQYKTKLEEASKKTGWKREEVKKSVSVPLPAAAAPAKPPVAVAPPTVGSFKLLTPTPSSTPAPTTGGFVPSLPSAPQPGSGFTFGFGAAKPATSAPAAAEKKETQTSKLVGDLIADGANGKEAAADQQAGKDKSWQVPAMFKGAAAASEEVGKGEAPPTPAPTPSAASTSTPSKSGSLFAFGPSNPSASTAAATPPKTFAFSAPASKLGKFGPGGTTPSLSFGGASSTPSGTPSTAAKSGFSFGASSPSASTSGSKPAFSFGSPAPAASTPSTEPPKSSGFSFGASATSKPTFSFGQNSSDAKPSPFSGFGGAAAAGPSTASSAEPSPPVETEEPEEEASTSTNLAAAGGAGEENEETVIEQRCKVFKLADGKQNPLGIVVLRLKREKANGDGKRKRRILARIDPGGSVVLNFGLNASMKPVVKANTVAFIGFDQDGKPANYTLKVKNADMATALGDALRKEAEDVAAGQ